MSPPDEDDRERLAREIAFDLATAPPPPRNAPNLRTPAEIRAEAKRQQGNVRWSHGEDLASRDETFALQKRERLFPEMFGFFGHEAKVLLTWGQSLFVLDADADAAQRTFAELSNWLPMFEESLRGPLEKHEERDQPGVVIQYDPHWLIAPVVCLALAGDRASLKAIASVDKGAVFVPPAKFIKDMRPWREFAFDLLDLLSGNLGAVRDRPRTAPAVRDLLAGYEKMPLAIAANDLRAFEALRAQAELAFPKRAKRRESSLNWYGEGKIAQSATFDAMGTALCRLARWSGMDVRVDTPLYPARFHK